MLNGAWKPPEQEARQHLKSTRWSISERRVIVDICFVFFDRAKRKRKVVLVIFSQANCQLTPPVQYLEKKSYSALLRSYPEIIHLLLCYCHHIPLPSSSSSFLPPGLFCVSLALWCHLFSFSRISFPGPLPSLNRSRLTRHNGQGDRLLRLPGGTNTDLGTARM